MASVIEICRMALLQVGSENLIESLEEPSKEAKLCKAYYQLALESLLREYSWNIANTEKQLTLFGTSSKYQFQYKYPNDCLRANAVFNPEISTDMDTVFNVSISGGVKVIQTDLEDAILSYTSKIIDPTQITDPMFIECLVLKLAGFICTPLTSDKQILQQITTLYQNALYKAQASDSNEGQAEQPNDADWIRARL